MPSKAAALVDLLVPAAIPSIRLCISFRDVLFKVYEIVLRIALRPFLSEDLEKDGAIFAGSFGQPGQLDSPIDLLQ